MIFLVNIYNVLKLKVFSWKRYSLACYLYNILRHFRNFFVVREEWFKCLFFREKKRERERESNVSLTLWDSQVLSVLATNFAYIFRLSFIYIVKASSSLVIFVCILLLLFYSILLNFFLLLL